MEAGVLDQSGSILSQPKTEVVERTFVLRGFDMLIAVMAAVSIAVGIIALAFSWVFYKNSQEINTNTIKSLTKISEKISKIDDIVSNQFNKLLGKAMDVESKGIVPITEIQFIKKIRKIRKKPRKKK